MVITGVQLSLEKLEAGARGEPWVPLRVQADAIRHGPPHPLVARLTTLRSVARDGQLRRRWRRRWHRRWRRSKPGAGRDGLRGSKGGVELAKLREATVRIHQAGVAILSVLEDGIIPFILEVTEPRIHLNIRVTLEHGDRLPHVRHLPFHASSILRAPFRASKLCEPEWLAKDPVDIQVVLEILPVARVRVKCDSIDPTP
mmetsp:Transcript_112473/g.251253  ORF Transcript_112473/g.251253 Transcript_112473/m.251253 type:complete len:200 (+) Transcript_112473:260-859(+)